MTRVVYRYAVEFRNQGSEVSLPIGCRILHVGNQDGTVCFWAEHHADPEVVPASTKRRFVIVGTGQEIPASAVYIGTTQDRGLVWHLYEVSS